MTQEGYEKKLTRYDIRPDAKWHKVKTFLSLWTMVIKVVKVDAKWHKVDTIWHKHDAKWHKVKTFLSLRTMMTQP